MMRISIGSVFTSCSVDVQCCIRHIIWFTRSSHKCSGPVFRLVLMFRHFGSGKILEIHSSYCLAIQ